MFGAFLYPICDTEIVASYRICLLKSDGAIYKTQEGKNQSFGLQKDGSFKGNGTFNFVRRGKIFDEWKDILKNEVLTFLVTIMPKSDAALQSYIDYLGMPKGSFAAVAEVYARMNSRIWLLENSFAMGELDSHLMKADQEFQVIERVDGVSRWDELSRCVEFHTKMASHCWIPTQFMLLNESGEM